MVNQNLLFDMTDLEYAHICQYFIGRTFRGIEECDELTHESFMEQGRTCWVFLVGKTSDPLDFAGMEHGIFMENKDGVLLSYIDFEIFGYLYTFAMRDKEFKQKIERFKKIARKLFMDNNDLNKFEFVKFQQGDNNDTN